MQLRAAFLVALGPSLTYCQQYQEQMTNDQRFDQDSADQQQGYVAFGSDRHDDQCLQVPMMPQSFTAKRVFFSIFNTIIFYDPNDQMIGFVQYWLGDWKNLFGYPGASFYVASNTQDADSGIWRINPEPDENGRWNHNSPQWTQQDSGFNGGAGGPQQDCRSEEFQSFSTCPPYCLWKDRRCNPGARAKNFWDHWFRGFALDESFKYSAHMTGFHDKAMGNPFRDEMIISDCQDRELLRAYDGQIVFRNAKDAIYIQQERNTENSLIIKDLGNPPQDLVRVDMHEPCKPFPPFCAKMGMWNVYNHAREWTGRNLNPAYIQSATQEFRFSMGDGAGTDIRFLCLFSAYQFSNTRFSPLMGWIFISLILISCCGCFGMLRCCCGGGGESTKVTPEAAREETEKLMKTVEAENKAPEQKPGFFACCSRRGGRTIG